MSRSIVRTIDLEGTTVKLGQRLLDRDSTEGLVLRAWPAGCTVTGGTVALPDAAVVLLTGRGACFEAIEFTGRAVIVCCGAGSHTTFRECAFLQCTLYAVHGAAVDLRRCTFSEAPLGLVTHGGATYATLTSCAFAGCTTAVIAECGATVTQRHCSVRDSRRALLAHDCGTRVTCIDGAYEGVAMAREDEGDGVRVRNVHGVRVLDAHVALRQCTVERFAHAVCIAGESGQAEVHDSIIRARQLAIVALGRATFTLRNCDLRLHGPLPAPDPVKDRGGTPSPHSLVAVHVIPGGEVAGRAQIERCTLSGTQEGHEGLIVKDCGRASLTHLAVTCASLCAVAARAARVVTAHSTLRSTSEIAFTAVGDKSHLTIVGGRGSGKLAAAACVERGAMVARGATLSGQAGTGAAGNNAVLVRAGGAVRLYECLLQHVQTGVQLYSGTAAAHNVTIAGPGRAAFGDRVVGYSQSGGRLSVTGGAVSGCACAVSLTDVEGGDGGAHACFEGVAFRDNMHAAAMLGGASLSLVRCVLSWRRGACAGPRAPPHADLSTPPIYRTAVFLSDDAGRATLAGCTIEGYDNGVQAMGPHGVEVSGCTFIGSASDVDGTGFGVHLHARGSVQSCEFSHTPRGVSALVPGCAVRGCRFGPAVRMGIVAEEESEVAVSACRFEHCGAAIVAQECAVVAVADSEVSSVEMGVDVVQAATVRARRLTVRGADLAVQVCSDTYKSRGAAVDLRDCVMSGASDGGVLLAGVGAAATLRGCTLSECKKAVAVQSGAAACVSDTLVTTCQIGVLVGVPAVVMGHECSVCGRSGDPAMAAAWQALRCAGSSGVPGARCMHEGACADATLRDLIVRDCIMGVQVSVTGRVEAERVEVRGALSPFEVSRIGAPSRLEQCVAAGGRAPSVLLRRTVGTGAAATYQNEPVSGVTVVDEGAPIECEEVWQAFRDADACSKSKASPQTHA